MKSYKHLLIAFDMSEASERAVAYVAEMISGRQDVRVLLLHVLNPVPPELLEFGGRENPIEENRAEATLRGMRSKWVKREQLATTPVFQRAQALLRRAGLPAKAVKMQVMTPDPNEALDSAILEVAKQKKCGTVVVGYTAFSWLKRHMQSHLVKALLEKAKGLAVWAVE